MFMDLSAVGECYRIGELRCGCVRSRDMFEKSGSLSKLHMRILYRGQQSNWLAEAQAGYADRFDQITIIR